MLSLTRLSPLVRVSRLLSTGGTIPSGPTPEATVPSFDFEFDSFLDNIGRDVEGSNKGLSFAKMLRQSKLVQLGDFNGRAVIGKIVHRMADDLYIDVGLKFNAVVKVPPVNSEHYAIGAQVIVRLHDYELSERFLGAKKDLTLLEADATLLRLLHSHKSFQKKERESPAKPKPIDEDISTAPSA